MRIVSRARVQFLSALAVAALPILPAAACRPIKQARAASVSAAHSTATSAGRNKKAAVPKLQVPTGYRTSYEYLGSWAIAADSGRGSKQLHEVYASPGTIAAFRKTGGFRNGTVLIKEVYETTTAPMTTGIVSRAGTLKGWFVLVRDTENDHPGSMLWGDGWGWGWFDRGNPTRTTSTNFKSDCLTCHVPARATEWIYTSGYRPLQGK